MKARSKKSNARTVVITRSERLSNHYPRSTRGLGCITLFWLFVRRLIRPIRIVFTNRQHTRCSSIARRLQEIRKPQISTDVHRFEPAEVPIRVDPCPSVAKHDRASSRATIDRASDSMIGVNEASHPVKAMATIGSYSYSAKRYSYSI